MFAILVGEPRISTGSLVHSIPLLLRSRIASSVFPLFVAAEGPLSRGKLYRCTHSNGICGAQYLTTGGSEHNVMNNLFAVWKTSLITRDSLHLGDTGKMKFKRIGCWFAFQCKSMSEHSCIQH